MTKKYTLIEVIVCIAILAIMLGMLSPVIFTGYQWLTGSSDKPASVSYKTGGMVEQYVAKNYGGTMTIDLNEGRKLVNITWKNESVWVLTRKKRDGEISEEYEFKESSLYGVLQGMILIKEK